MPETDTQSLTVVQHAEAIIEQTERERIEELAETIRMLAGDSMDDLAPVIAEDAKEGFLCAYFEDYFDNPRALDPEDVQNLKDAIKEYRDDHYPDERLHFHLSGSDSHEWVDDGHSKYVGVSIG